MECVVNSPREDEPSYEQFQAEKKGVLSSLAMRAKMVVEAFNSVPGMSCNIVQGAMYAFPQVCTAFLIYYMLTGFSMTVYTCSAYGGMCSKIQLYSDQSIKLTFTMLLFRSCCPRKQ